VGPPCPVEAFPADLPAGTLHVLDGAAGGGDGSAALPFATLAEAIAVVSAGDTIALSRGTFEETAVLREAVTLRGACSLETAIVAPSAGATTLRVAGGARIQDLRIGGPRVGIQATVGVGAVGLDSVVIAGATAVGLLVDPRASVEAVDVVIRDTASAAGDGGQGIEAAPGARLVIDRAVLERNHNVGIVAAGAEIDATDLAVVDTEGREGDGAFGYGVQATGGTMLDLERAVFQGNRVLGLLLAEEGTSLTALDFVIRSTREDTAGLSGGALEIRLDAAAQVERATLDDNGGGAVFVTEGATIVLRDVVVRDTRAHSGDGDYGYGLDVSGGAFADLGRVAILRSKTVGVAVLEPGTSLIAADLRIEETESRPSNGKAGMGLEVTGGASVTLQRAALRANRVAGVYVAIDGSAATLEGILVEGTLPAACAATDCADLAGGTAIVTFADATVVATDFRLSDSALCGVQLALGATVDLHSGEISRNLIGANVQTEGFDVGRLEDGVVYRDNQRDLDAEALPIPQVE